MSIGFLVGEGARLRHALLVVVLGKAFAFDDDDADDHRHVRLAFAGNDHWERADQTEWVGPIANR